MQNKIFAVFLVCLVYILGLVSFECELEIAFAAVLLTVLIISIAKDKLDGLFGVFLYIFFFLAIFNAGLQIKDYDALSNIGFANNVMLEGTISAIPKKSLNDTRLAFELDVKRVSVGNRDFKDIKAKASVMLTRQDGNFNGIQIGDYIRLKGNLRKPPAAKNPVRFDYAKYLKYRGIFTSLYSGEIPEIISKPKFSKEPWQTTLQAFNIKREEIMQKHSKYIKSPRFEILGGIVFGYRAVDSPEEVNEAFRNSGLIHLLAASGLNVALIFGIWWFIATKARLPYRLSILTGIVIVVLYTFMTGFPPSILRASFMILIVLLAKLWHKEINALSSIFFVCLLILLFDPKMLNDIGFQLSFLVTLGLLTCLEPIGGKFEELDAAFKADHKEKHPVLRGILAYFSPKYLSMMLFVPVVAQAWAMPLQMYYFNTFTPYSVFANVAAVPFAGAISFSGFVSALLALLPFDFFIRILDFFINPLAQGMLSISLYFSNLKNSVITVPAPSVFSIILYYMLLLFFIHLLKINFENKKLNTTFMALSLVLCLSFVRLNSGSFEILAYDVGNADSFLIKTPKSKYIMIDTARLPYKGHSQAERVILQHLKNINVKSLELLVITHFDNDHSGGAVDVLKNMKVKKVLICASEPDTPSAKHIMSFLHKNNIHYEIVKNNSAVYLEPDFSVKTFAASDLKSKKFENENSIVTLIESKGKTALFMGDAGHMAFSGLKNDLPKGVDILKIGHHGAKGSLNYEMADYLNPKIAIISTGYNVYGHPSYGVVRMLEDKNVEVLNTELLGAIKIVQKDQKGSLVKYHYHRGRFEKLD